VTQQHGADWQPCRAEKHSPENPGIFNHNNMKDIALLIFETHPHPTSSRTEVP